MRYLDTLKLEFLQYPNRIQVKPDLDDERPGVPKLQCAQDPRYDCGLPHCEGLT
jgi:hypothetical protein